MDMDAQLSWFPAQAGQLASYLVLYFGYFGYGNIKGTTLFLFKKKHKNIEIYKKLKDFGVSVC
jgi:hypothetical protein